MVGFPKSGHILKHTANIVSCAKLPKVLCHQYTQNMTDNKFTIIENKMMDICSFLNDPQLVPNNYLLCQKVLVYLAH